MSSDKTASALESLRKMPRDRGWAWVVLIAAWLNNIMVSGIYKSFGILFIEIQTKFGSTSAQTSLVYSLLNASFSFTSLIIAILDLKTVSIRQCIAFGTALSCIGYLVPAFVSDVDLVIVILGVGLGVGQGFIFTPQMTLVGQYFDRRKGLANCVALTGGSAGALILPYLIGLFKHQYGFSGTMLLLAGLNLNGIVFAALMRPFPMEEFNRLKEIAEVETLEDCCDELEGESTPQKITDGTTKEVDEQLNDFKEQLMDNKDKFNETIKQRQSYNDIIKKTNRVEFKEIPKHMEETHDELKGRRERNNAHNDSVPSNSDKETSSMLNKTIQSKFSPQIYSFNHNGSKSKLKSEAPFLHSPYLQRSLGAITRSSLYASSEFTVPSMEDLSVCGRRDKEMNVNTDDYITPDTSLCEKVKSKLKSLLNIRVLKTPVFLYYLPFAVLIANGSSMYLSFMLPHAKDVGLSGTEIKSLLTIIAIVDVLTIPLWGVLADRRYFKSNKLVVIAMVCIAMPCLFVKYYDTYGTILMFSAFYGIFGRVYFSLSPVILVEFLGLDNLRSSLGIAMVVQAVFHSIMLPIVGLMRDEYGTYIASYQMMGSFLLVGAVGVLIMPELAIRIHGDPLKENDHDVA